MAGRGAGAGWAVLTICGALLGWELVVPATVTALWPEASEVQLYAIDKLGFAVVLAGGLTDRQLWWRCGFAGGLRADAQGLLWPLWLITAFSAMLGFADRDAGRLLGWFAISAAVGFGEEGVFRGVIVAALGIARPRRAVAISSLLFGALHLAGLLAPLDPRLIIVQAATATCLGLVLGSVRLLARSIWPGIIAHTALDFFGLAAAGSVSDAMAFSRTAVIAAFISAAISLAWVAVLWRRLPAAA
jgi:membrane protease YdiL (CAAX protease family)